MAGPPPRVCRRILRQSWRTDPRRDKGPRAISSNFHPLLLTASLGFRQMIHATTRTIGSCRNRLRNATVINHSRPRRGELSSCRQLSGCRGSLCAFRCKQHSPNSVLPCRLSEAMFGQPGYKPPPPRLVRCHTQAPGAARGLFQYVCQDCGCTIALAQHINRRWL